VKLPEAYKTANLMRQAAIGWAVDPDDVPAHPRQGVTARTNPELVARRQDEVAYHRWLAVARYQPDAGELGKLMLTDYPDHQKAVREYANGLELIARDFQEWSP
jgi:hypothetical protein